MELCSVASTGPGAVFRQSLMGQAHQQAQLRLFSGDTSQPWPEGPISAFPAIGMGSLNNRFLPARVGLTTRHPPIPFTPFSSSELRMEVGSVPMILWSNPIARAAERTSTSVELNNNIDRELESNIVERPRYSKRHKKARPSEG